MNAKLKARARLIFFFLSSSFYLIRKAALPRRSLSLSLTCRALSLAHVQKKTKTYKSALTMTVTHQRQRQHQQQQSELFFFFVLSLWRSHNVVSDADCTYRKSNAKCEADTDARVASGQRGAAQRMRAQSVFRCCCCCFHFICVCNGRAEEWSVGWSEERKRCSILKFLMAGQQRQQQPKKQVTRLTLEPLSLSLSLTTHTQ